MASVFSGKAGRQAAQALYDQVKEGRHMTLAELGRGYDQAAGLFDQANEYYTPYAEAGGAALPMYLSSLGLNGERGNAEALKTFQAGPGYQFALDQGTQAANRAAAAGGMTASGNTLMALSRFGHGLANQEYGNWQDRLAGLGQMGLQTAGAQAGNRQALGALAADTSRAKANTIYNSMAAQGGATAGGLMAGQNAAANRINLGMQALSGLGSLAMGAFGGPRGAGMFAPGGAFGGK